VNSAEAYLDYLKDSGIVGFYNYAMLKMNYENWCAHNGLVSLGVTTLKRTMGNEAGALRRTIKEGEKVVHRYQFAEAADEDLVWLDNGYGLRDKSDAEIVEKDVQKQGTLSKDW